MKCTVSTVSVKYSVSRAPVKYSISTVSVKCSVSTVSAQRQRSTTSVKYTYCTVSVKYSAREALCQYSINEEHCQCSTPLVTITTILYSSQREIKAAVRSHEQYNRQGIVYSRYSALSPQNRICLAPQREQTATVHPHREKQKKDQREKKPCSSFRCLPT